MKKKHTWREYAGVVVAVVLVAVGIDMVRDAYGLYQEDIVAPSQSEEMLADKSDWITYTNTAYGYEISYPPEVEFVKVSDQMTGNVEAITKNQIVFIGDTEGALIFNMSAGAPTVEYSATSSHKLKDSFLERGIPALTDGQIGKELSLAREDFRVNEVTHNDRPAIEIISPIGYSLQISSQEGRIFSITARDYQGATSTPKERLTREIMETFTVLD